VEIKDLRGWLVHNLQDLYSAENMVLAALPQMEQAASDQQLKQAFKMHREQTQQQVQRLEEAFEKLGEQPDTSVTCKGMEGLVKEGEEVLKKKAEIPAEVLDAALIESAQKVEHYEIAAYGSAAAYANSLQERRVANLMKETLDEERETDKKLTKLAEDGINRQAKSG
jgi:ferritin-like metal-binding protein YciE